MIMKHTELLRRNEVRHVDRLSTLRSGTDWNRCADAHRENEFETSDKVSLPPQSVILVGMDFSEPALKAMDCALALAGRFQASVMLLHIVNPFFTSGLANRITRNKARTEARRRAQEDLRQLALAKRNPTVNIKCVVRHGVPEYEILRAAERHGASLIVLGHHPRNSLSRLILGSVSRSVLTAAPCPVVVVNRHSAPTLPMTQRAVAEV